MRLQLKYLEMLLFMSLVGEVSPQTIINSLIELLFILEYKRYM